MTDKEYSHFWYQCQRLGDLKEEVRELRQTIRDLVKQNGRSDTLSFCAWQIETTFRWIKGKSLQVKINHLAFCRDVVKGKLAYEL